MSKEEKMSGTNSDMIFVSDLSELIDSGCLVTQTKKYSIAVFANEGEVYAIDNRCPHMGFPLSRGSVKNGILTCHWHEAMFELSGGCTFDLWADDLIIFETARAVDRSCARGDFISMLTFVEDPIFLNTSSN